MPVAAQAIQTAMIPQVIQTSAGQQIVMQQVHIAQPQIAQPQYAQILMPNGQIQQVPVVQPQQMLGGLGGIQIQQPQQIAIQTSTGTLTTSTASSSTSSTTAVVASPIASTSSTSAMINPKVEPVEIKSEIMDEKQSQQTVQQQVQQVQQQQQPQQQQQQQFITMNLNGQQIMVQQPVNQTANTAGAVQQVLRTANGQVIQVANLPGQTMVQAAQPNTIQIPGLGTVQVMNSMPVTQPANTAQFAATAAAATGAQNATQIINATAQPQFASATQTALQQDPNDPNKWHVVQVACAQAPTATAVQPAGT